MSAKPTKDGTPQKRLNFDVPEELANEFKAYASLQGKTQRELVIAFMQRCINRGHSLSLSDIKDQLRTGTNTDE